MNKLQFHATSWMGLTNITLREGRQAQKSIEGEDILDGYASAGLEILCFLIWVLVMGMFSL